MVWSYFNCVEILFFILNSLSKAGTIGWETAVSIFWEWHSEIENSINIVRGVGEENARHPIHVAHRNQILKLKLLDVHL